MSRTTAYDGIDLMLNCEDDGERDELTRNWRDHKLQELNFVGTVVRISTSPYIPPTNCKPVKTKNALENNQDEKGALLASCLSSTSAWPDVLNNGRDKPWSVRALWFSGLVFALFAVMISGLQSMRLHRLSAHRDGLAKIRAGLAGGRGRSDLSKRNASSTGMGGLKTRLPRWFQVYAWDAGHAFLILSVALMIAGIAVLVWVSTEYGPDKPEDGGWWDENSKVCCFIGLMKEFPRTYFLAILADYLCF